MHVANLAANVGDMARIKTDAERGPVGVWLKRERLAHGWTPEDVVAQLRERTGTVIRVDYYRQIEARTAGKVPSAELQADLERVYGTAPTPLPDPEPEPPSLSADTLALVGAIDRLTAAVEAQQQDGPIWAQAVVDAVLAGRQLRSADAGRDGR